MLKLKSNIKFKPIVRTKNPVSFCKDVKKNPKKYKPNVIQSCKSLLARNKNLEVKKKKRKKNTKKKIMY
jgi:hypothetical protein